MKGIDRQEETGEEIEIFTPAQMSRLFSHASPDLLPVLSIGGLGGLRTAEVLRLDWSEIHLSERFIEVKNGKSKTRSRPTVPITDNLSAWLSPYAAKHGVVWPHSVPFAFEAMATTGGSASVEWRHNALRHSFISYRFAEIKNENQVALEAANSPNMVHGNYKGSPAARAARRA